MIGTAEKIWLTLITLTLASAFFAETGQAGWLLTMTVVVLIAVKGGLVIDYYMELKAADQRFRNVVRLFIVLVAVLIIVSHGWGDVVRDFINLD